jgi:hypothetical protein
MITIMIVGRCVSFDAVAMRALTLAFGGATREGDRRDRLADLMWLTYKLRIIVNISITIITNIINILLQLTSLVSGSGQRRWEHSCARQWSAFPSCRRPRMARRWRC